MKRLKTPLNSGLSWENFVPNSPFHAAGKPTILQYLVLTRQFYRAEFAFKSTAVQGFQLMDNRQTNSAALGAQVFLQALHKMLMTTSAGLMPSINLSESYPK